MVPKIRDANQKDIKELSKDLKKVSDDCRNLKIDKKEFFGGSMTITSLGGIGGSFFTPIINPPEVAILGISKTYEKVVSSTNGFENRSFLPISLSYDHRAINGVYAVQFTSQLGEALSDDKLIEKSFK